MARPKKTPDVPVKQTRPKARPVAVAKAISAELLEKYKDFPGIRVIERRLENPDLPGSLPIRLKDEPDFISDPKGARRVWYVRWINTIQEGRWSQVVDAMGYVPVKVDELQNAQAIPGLSNSGDGIVRKGDKGYEVLVKMPLELYTDIKRRQQERRERRARNAKLVKEDLANRAAASEDAGGLGSSEAADTIYDDFDLTIKRAKRTTIGAELEEESELVDQA